MNNIYYFIGFSFFWISSLIAFVYVTYYFIKLTGDAIGRKYKFLWIIVEFQFYKKDFKEWVKDKERHVNMQEQLPIHDDIGMSYCLEKNLKGEEYKCEQQCDSCRLMQENWH